MNEIEIIQQVEQFYNSAWEKLIITGSIIFGVVGIIFPIIFQILQSRTLKLQEKEIKADTETRINKIKEELQKEIRKEFQNEIKKLDTEINKKSKKLMGMGFHLQANSSLKEKKYVLATRDYIYAVQKYLEGEDYNNLSSVIQALIDKCFINIKHSDLDDIFSKADTSEKEYFEMLRNNDVENRASKLIGDLKYKMSKVPN